MDKLISEIADDEKVARILFSPSHIYKGRVSQYSVNSYVID